MIGTSPYAINGKAYPWDIDDTLAIGYTATIGGDFDIAIDHFDTFFNDKDIFLEDIEYSDKDLQKEMEADNFAVKWTLSEEQEKEIIASFPLNEKKIVAFAKQFNTHPAMIVGRLRRKKLINFILGKKFIQAISL